MTSGRAEACLGCLLLVSAGAAGAADLDSLLQSLAREPPQTIAFVETHTSQLLERQLVVSGMLEYKGNGKLSRVVTVPYRERIDIDGSDVRIQREGRPERRFSLRRGTELSGVLSAFSALLAGDRTALEASFELTAEFLAGGWQLDLVPKKSGRKDRIGEIRVRGEGDAPACLAVLGPDGSAATVIRLGAAAHDGELPYPAGCSGPTR